ncbi:hypothetical protein ACSYDW_07255 [Paeniglutamicibacter sp. R2-26]
MSPDEYQAYVKSVVDEAPPLSAEQCATISRIMLPKGWQMVPPAQVADAA